MKGPFTKHGMDEKGPSVYYKKGSILGVDQIKAFHYKKGPSLRIPRMVDKLDINQNHVHNKRSLHESFNKIKIPSVVFTLAEKVHEESKALPKMTTNFRP